MHWMHLPLITTERIFPSLLALTIASSLPAYGGKFNPKFLENVQGIDQHIDLSVYDSPVGQQIPGKYRVSVFVNEEKMASRTLDFSTASEAKRKASGESLMPCLSRVQLEEMGVRVTAFVRRHHQEACVVFVMKSFPRPPAALILILRRCIFPFHRRQ